jgi:hypothetical protein
MDRQQREAELRTMLTTQRGKEELLATLKKHAGMEEGNLPPFGTLLVETILNLEYPPEGPTASEEPRGTSDADATKPAQVKAEPGDVKFAEPPAQEAPGG